MRRGLHGRPLASTCSYKVDNVATKEEPQMPTVGVRELKDRLSQYLKRVKAGERLVVTERGAPIAIITPPPKLPADERIEAMLRKGLARWGGGKPRGSSRPARVSGPSVAQAIIEGRR